MTDPTFGLLLNLGANLGPTPDAVFDLTLRQAERAEELGYHDLWVTEHHFIGFGINPSALTTAGFLLGRTRRLRVGTAVVLSPLLHPVEVAERAALLDQWSGGRFDLGLGRGGYVRDYEVLDVPTERWDDEPGATAATVLDLWAGGAVDGTTIEPSPRAPSGPPLLLATSTGGGLAFAARHGLALQHYFSAPVEARVKVEARYAELRAEAGAEANGASTDAAPAHLHTLIVVVTDDPAGTRERLAAALVESFIAGDHPMVPQAPERHVGPDGKPYDRTAMAHAVAKGAIVGPPAEVVDRLGAFIEATGARRLALYAEAVADPAIALSSIERFATDVAPQLARTTAPAPAG